MSTPLASRTRIRVWIAVLAAVIVAAIPLAVNGLFASALSGAQEGLSRFPAALVNNDAMLTTTAPDGTESIVFAGRGLVTELTGDEAAGFDWRLTNSDAAEKGLADGTYYAVLTIPEDFSRAVSSQGSADPRQASVSIETDDAHGYLAGLIASTASTALQAGFGQTITAQVVGGVYSGFSTLGGQFEQAAFAAGQIGSGATDLGDGLGQLAEGTGSAAAGADGLAAGADQLADGLGRLGEGAAGAADGATEFAAKLGDYTAGVDGIAGGLGALAGETTGLGRLTPAVGDYTKGVTGSADALVMLNATIQGDPDLSQDVKAAYQRIVDGMVDLSGAGDELAQSVAGMPDLESGIADLAAGSAALSQGSPAVNAGAQGLAGGLGDLASGIQGAEGGSARLSSGASDLGGGLGQIADGVQQAADGSTQLGQGASSLASGLQTGADQLTARAFANPQRAAETVANPLVVDVSTQNKVGDIGQVIATLMVPTGLWIGALAIFLVIRPLRSYLLAGGATSARLVTRAFVRASAIAAAQVAIVVAYLHLGLSVPWSALPLTLGFTLLASLAFVAFHQFLSTALGRVGTVVSLVMLAVMLAAAGGLYPVEMLSGPFQAINAVSPLSFAVDGVRAIITGGSLAPVAAGSVVLTLLLFASLLFAGVALRYRRSPLRSGWLRRTRLAPV